jgi:uncharacterized protein (TIGR00730 family)
MLDFLNGSFRIRIVGPSITIFGSARFHEQHPNYILTRKLSAEIGSRGINIITGGGPGLMEAANRGAKDVGAFSAGFNIQLPQEQSANKYLDLEVSFRYFFVRKFMLTKYSRGFVVAPGGFGTLDELFEVITLIQTEKIKKFPIYLLGTAYWNPLLKHLSEVIMKSGAIDRTDLALIHISDDPKEIADMIQQQILSYGHPHKNLKRIQELF